MYYKKEYEDKAWQDQFENRICYVIETISESLYCGECVVKDISANIPEIEIELMPEYHNQGIGYKAIIMMLSKLAEKYWEQEFYVKMEPDNYASQFLFEKLGKILAGLVKDYKISGERAYNFIETHRYLFDERMQNIAKKFDIEADLLLTHLLVYKLDYEDLESNDINVTETANKRKYVECMRTLSKEKHKDVIMELLEEI